MRLQLLIKLALTCMVLVMPAVSVRAAEPPQYFSSIQDIPLMPGLKELPEQTVTFDQPEGRIVESVALAESASPESAARFYEDTLPQLGWRKTGPLSFVREKEFLKMVFEDYQGQKFLRVSVSPAPATPN